MPRPWRGIARCSTGSSWRRRRPREPSPGRRGSRSGTPSAARTSTPRRRCSAALAADALLLCELDLGMARSGQAHTTRDARPSASAPAMRSRSSFWSSASAMPASRRGMPGRSTRPACTVRRSSARSALERPAVIRLETTGDWFDGRHGERRVGGRIAVAATLDDRSNARHAGERAFREPWRPGAARLADRPADRGDRGLCARPAGADRRRSQHLDGEPRLGARHRGQARPAGAGACSTRCPSSPCSRSRPGRATTGEPATR